MALFRRNKFSEPIRKHIVFYGQVQAVGFRWRAINAAKLYGTTGWVRNDTYGSVTMEIQGSARDIESVIASLNNDDYIRIDHMEEKEIPLDNEERSFRVKY